MEVESLENMICITCSCWLYSSCRRKVVFHAALGTHACLFWVAGCSFDNLFFCVCVFKDFIYLFSERWEGREKDRKRNINVWEIHQLVTSHTPLTGDLAHNPGLCPDQELNWWPFGSQVFSPLSHNSQGDNLVLWFFLAVMNCATVYFGSVL